VLISAFGPQMMRAVTHLDVSAADVDLAAEALDEAAREAAGGQKPMAVSRGAYV
jgi:hypothetical protein